MVPSPTLCLSRATDRAVEVVQQKVDIGKRLQPLLTRRRLRSRGDGKEQSTAGEDHVGGDDVVSSKALLASWRRSSVILVPP
jgi:hypothetical protein